MSMAAQTSYGFGFSKGVSGGLFDLSVHEVVTRQAEGSGITFGLGVVAGTNKGVDVTLPDSSATASAFEGIVVHNSVMVEKDMDNNVEIADKKTVGCIVSGKLWAALAPGAEPTYKGTAYLVTDGDYAGYFTSQSTAYSVYEKCDSTTTDAKEVVADSATATDTQIKVSEVTPVASGYVPAVGDYVVSKQVYGAGLDVGVKFESAVDSDAGIAVVKIG